MFSVRRLVRTDASAVLRINSDGYPGVARLDEPEFSRLCSLPNYHLAATDINGSLAGYSLAFARNAAYDGEEFLEFRLLSREPYLYIDQVAVAKESKGMGVGRALYDVLEEMARRDGAQALCCEVNTVPPNPESTAFHRALNFRRVGSFVTSDAREVELLLKRIP